MIKRLLAAFLALGLCASAHAQSGKVSKILVGFPPGQATDLVARILAERLGPALGETVIVENRPGQGGSVALAALAKSPPDGGTMMLSALASLVANPHLYKSVGYDTLKDFEPIALVADLPLLLVVHPSVPVRTVPELIAYAKANPDKLSHPSSGNGTLSHLAMEDFKRRAGITILHVPYQGSARAMADLMAGTVTVGMDTVAVTQPHVQAGKMRLIAAGTATRLAAFPDTPTIAEQGFLGFSASAWLGLLYPAGTPKDLVERTSAAVAKIVQSPDVEQKFAAIGAIPRSAGPAEFRRFLQEEYQRWGAIVKASGARVD
ncbi:MAG TPA: tripartite tricarboxylate transporter substrate binding protein [Burkholderiales bacterium]|nr:tripartite tricarboxylate transporter substrate binding protein [Burkholderiales bacterium]